MTSTQDPESLLQPPSSTSDSPSTLSRHPSTYHPLSTYNLPTSTRTYTQQFSDIYFSRLTLLKPPTVALAAEAWDGFTLGSESATRVDRVLDVRQGELCWVVGTVFMDLPLKPNVMEDVGREHWIAAPVGRKGKFFTEDGEVDEGFGKRKVMLEDESGRLRLAGEYLDRVPLVTGVIVAVLGTENADGEFEVLDLKGPELPRQPERWEVQDTARGKKGTKRVKGGKIAFVGGLGITGEEGDMLSLELLAEYLLGEAGGSQDAEEVSAVSRLVVVGNSLDAGGPIPSREELATKHKSGQTRKYGYDSSTYNSAPTDLLDNWLATLLPSIPITLLPGDSDPTHAALPQQPIHAALLPRARAYMPPPTSIDGKKQSSPTGWFDSVTNPWEGEVDGWRMLATGGQPIEDMFRYVKGDDRVEMMENTLRWRVVAPTCPDTLWCYPFQEQDAFVLRDCPHIYVAGNQPRFDTAAIEGPNGQSVRLIALPRFKETGEVVFMDAETLEVEVVKFDVFGGD